MCDPVTAAVAVGGGLFASTFLGNKQQQQAVQQPTTPTAPAAPQAAKTPDQAQSRADGSATAANTPGFGVGQTLLTGPAGIDTSLLSLGKSTLAGGTLLGG